jgi:hypothetical protein
VQTKDPLAEEEFEKKKMQVLNAQNLNQDASVSQLGGRSSEAAAVDPHDTFKKAL